MHLMTWLGLTSGNSVFYLFWSGIGGYMTILAVLYRKMNCHDPWCWRLGHYSYEHKHFCKKHHPVERLL